jgi:hypothetical protein
MITIYPDNSLAWLAIVAVSLATAAVSYFLTRRWHWKAVPLVALAGLLVPITIVAIAIAALPLMSDDRAIGFMTASSDLLTLGLCSALAGFAGHLALWRLLQRGR